MNADLVWQFDLVWALAEVHIEALTDDDFLWEPASLTWTVRPDDSGVWRPDWADTEPEPVPVPTIGWLTWHIMWWWSTAIDHLIGTAPRSRTDVLWPGNGDTTVTEQRDLAVSWRTVLTGLTSDRLVAPSSFPWGDNSGRTVAQTALWVNVELMKNIAEIGQLRLMRAVHRP